MVGREETREAERLPLSLLSDFHRNKSALTLVAVLSLPSFLPPFSAVHSLLPAPSSRCAHRKAVEKFELQNEKLYGEIAKGIMGKRKQVS
jgi:hypothetical protein